MGLTLYAQCVQNQTAAQSGGIMSWIPLIVIFFIFYFILILPEQKKIKQHKQMLEQLKKGDNVLLSCGIYGTVVNVKGDTIELKIAENVKINVLKSAVSQIVPEEKIGSL
ncbi:MAG: preprotein translocase subunit YajC [Endomicrobia bacterium]|nr:preprotein translocase subunit YajC [Endomicrobiia bacterium]MCX7940569.1 preprotein translocase subunit YajC [Endomicrobiia bacterium]MDW8056263.1 preprotein translocase subunit YajC [Elusimicrobiota bacterium]